MHVQIPTIDDIREVVRSEIESTLTQILINQDNEQIYLTRKQTAKLLNISLVTLNEWTKRGVLTKYRINSRIRYRKDEVLSAIQKVKGVQS